MQIVKVRIDDFAMRAEHRPFTDVNSRAITDQNNVVVHPDAVFDLNNRLGTARLHVNITVQEIRRRIEPEIDLANEPNRSFPNELHWLPNDRLALNIRAVGQEAKFRYSVPLVKMQEPISHCAHPAPVLRRTNVAILATESK